ncbi:hypothetical protein EDD11_004245 [Mortierella claussenii]|nr:hypothetical protein EDD11_004245 [Mortierella claussenii]
MAKPLHCLGGGTRTFISARHRKQQQLLATSIHTSARIRNQQHHDNTAIMQDQLQTSHIRENSINAREPNYGGWWTEVMNHRTTPQALPDPTLLLSEDHVFQGRPAMAPVPASPTTSEIKKGYINTLPTTASKRIDNTLPTAVSTGSSTFTTGSVSSLSKSAAESTLYHGFRIPVKPTPPGAEDCCMSGCAHCIYDMYEEDRQDYKTKLAKVLKDIKKAGLPPPPNIVTSGSGDGGDEDKGADDDMDPGMKAFLELERKLKGS